MPRSAVLVVDDNPTNLKLIRVVLAAEGYEVHCAADASAALELLRQLHPGMILMDLQMPGMDGYELTRRLKGAPQTCEIPIIAVTSYAMKGDEEKARACGCDDYVTKPIDTDELVQTVAAHLARAPLRARPAPEQPEPPPVAAAAPTAAAATLPGPAAPGKGPAAFSERVLVVDDERSLLRVYRHWLEGAGYRVETAADGGAAVTLLGRERFDLILSDIAMQGMGGVQLLRAVRESDLDVPVILMTGTPSVETAIQAVELGALRYLVKPFGQEVLEQVVTYALRVHKLAKLRRAALDLVGDPGKQLGDRAGLGASLDRAIATLWMAYQPIVRWSTRSVFAYEALLRSGEPHLPRPIDVLEAAERLGRLPELGRAIRERVAGEIERAPCEYVFINLHPSDLLDDALYSASAPLSRHAGRVVLEITERASLEQIHDTPGRVARLREMGFRIALDDLGAGYAGLTSFAQLEPEVVKFDGSLVRGLHENETKRALLRSMTTLFGELGLLSIAEGVETAPERDALAELGCDLLQGYLFARPGPAFPAAAW